ncbi:MAG: response regulator [Venatoribacter sp.]
MQRDAFIPDSIPILVVDDDPTVIEVSRLVLSHFRFQQSRLKLIEAHSAKDAKIILQQRTDIALILLDVVMEQDDSGLALVNYIRNELNNHRIRILLRTGQPGYAPEQQVVIDYDINDYLLKSEITQARLTLSITSALRSYFDILLAEELTKKNLEAEREKDIATRASEAKTRYFAHLSHELRGAINVISGTTELLADRVQGNDNQELLRRLVHSKDTLLELINSVLDIAKIEAGKEQLHQGDFSISQLFDKLRSIFASSMALKNIHFQINLIEPMPVRVRGDAQKIQQVVSNLLSNALKFTPFSGSVLVTVQCLVSTEQAQLQVLVADTGAGIANDKLDVIFNAYEQANQGIAKQYGGTGLGLSLSKQLATLMNAELYVRSSLGKGSTFYFNVPVSLPSDQGITAELQPKQDKLSLAGLTLAVCEDDYVSQQVLKHFLNKHGAQVVLFQSGEELLAYPKLPSLNVILLDYYLTGQDGADVATKLRQQHITAPILALSGIVSAADKERCLAAGVNQVITKPIDFNELLQRLSQLL